MNKKLLTYLVVTLIVLVTITSGWYIYKQKQTTSGPIDTVVNDLFPQGSIVSNIANNIVDTINPGGDEAGFFNNQANQSGLGQGMILGLFTTSSSSVATYLKPESGKVFIYDQLENKNVFTSNTTKVGLFGGEVKQTTNGYNFLLNSSPNNLNMRNEILVVNTNTATTSAKEIFINEDQQAVLSPDGSSVFYLREESSGVVGIIKNINTNQEKSIFSSPLTSWFLEWPSKNTIVLKTKPGKEVRGYLYTLSTEGILNQVLGDVDSLVTKTSPDTKKIIYNQYDNTLSTYLYDTEKKTSSKLGIKTIVDKCAWFTNETVYCLAPRENLTDTSLEDWYKGKINFTDDLWTINIDTQVVTKTGILPIKLDGYSLLIDSQGKNIASTNKLDGSIVIIPIK